METQTFKSLSYHIELTVFTPHQLHPQIYDGMKVFTRKPIKENWFVHKLLKSVYFLKNKTHAFNFLIPRNDLTRPLLHMQTALTAICQRSSFCSGVVTCFDQKADFGGLLEICLACRRWELGKIRLTLLNLTTIFYINVFWDFSTSPTNSNFISSVTVGCGFIKIPLFYFKKKEMKRKINIAS